MKTTVVQVVRFCCHAHEQHCRLKAKKPKGRTGREALTVQQVSHLVAVLCLLGAPWAAVLCLFQLSLGERADAARRLDAQWVTNLDLGSAGLPTVAIPKVNGKTTPRSVALPAFLVRLVNLWLDNPLVGAKNTQWPFEGHDLKKHLTDGTPRLLFPGRQVGGVNARNWDRAVSERAYLDKLCEAGREIAKERAEDRKNNKPHVFDDVDLDNLGTHTMKKTCVSLLKDANVSNAVISAITGTSIRTLDAVYDYPTFKRQREATAQAFGQILV